MPTRVDLDRDEVVPMAVSAGTQFICDCGAEIVYVRPCQDEEAVAPTCACGAVMYLAPVDDEEREFALVR